MDPRPPGCKPAAGAVDMNVSVCKGQVCKYVCKVQAVHAVSRVILQ
jgi:hypothetical protein